MFPRFIWSNGRYLIVLLTMYIPYVSTLYLVQWATDDDIHAPPDGVQKKKGGGCCILNLTLKPPDGASDGRRGEAAVF
jgi:hypothetical protein